MEKDFRREAWKSQREIISMRERELEKKKERKRNRERLLKLEM